MKKIRSVMDWWQKIVFPVRRVWLSLSSRVRTRKTGSGLLKLRDDIQTCGYEDVQVMWEMLRRSDSELTTAHHPKRKQQQPPTKHRPAVWRSFYWSSQSRH